MKESAEIRKIKTIPPLQWIFICLFAMGLSSCGDEMFTTKSESESYTANPITTNSTSTCSSFSLVRPKVDFLFLWDNSTSTVFINSNTKKALSQIINNISDRFDYHIMLAPLIVNSSNVNYQAKLISYNTDGLSSEATSMIISPSRASSTLSSFDLVGGSLEKGASRAVQLIKRNSVANNGNGIFRSGSYIYIIVMSNQDDNSWQEGHSPTPSYGGSYYTNYISEQTKKLLCLRGGYTPSSGNCTGFSLNSNQLRFMNISPFSNTSCSGVSSWKRGQTYQAISKKVYSEPYVIGGVTQTNRQIDQDDRADGLYDSYNLCSLSSFTTIFDGINNSINQSIVTHKYNFWPVATSGASHIDSDEIEVYKDGVSLTKLSTPVSGQPNGFTFTNQVSTVNTRYEPTVGEEFTGYVVRLYGNARVTYPECMVVKTQSPKEYFGYIALNTKPVESSIQVQINGTTLQNSSTNGWLLLKSGGEPLYYTNKNIKIVSPTNDAPATPEINKSGYMLKLYGSAIFSNGATINVIYDPSS